MENDKIDQIIDKYQGKASSLILILMELQHVNHWLPKEALTRVSEKLHVPIRHLIYFPQGVMNYTSARVLPVIFGGRSRFSLRSKS
jgi:NADH:ubiquinone oxidoreductase subunit E